MKKTLAVLLSMVLIGLLFAACGDATPDENAPETENLISATQEQKDKMTIVIEPTEYVLYQNIFYNDQGSEFEGQQVTKKGTFAILYDEYNNLTRYYVWGCRDETKCCDWQWEIVPDDTSNLPPRGSLVEVVGTFTANDDALDGYWIKNAKITVKTAYEGAKADVDMTTMSATLERVQIQNMQRFSENFEGKTTRMYGRVQSLNAVQHPYYDSSFSQEFITSGTVPAIGMMVTVDGVYRSGVIEDAVVATTNDF